MKEKRALKGLGGSNAWEIWQAKLEEGNVSAHMFPQGSRRVAEKFVSIQVTVITNHFLADFWPAALVIADVCDIVGVCSMVFATMGVSASCRKKLSLSCCNGKFAVFACLSLVRHGFCVQFALQGCLASRQLHFLSLTCGCSTGKHILFKKQSQPLPLGGKWFQVPLPVVFLNSWIATLQRLRMLSFVTDLP